MDILLSHGYFISEDAHEQKIMKPYPTLGLLYISSYLKSKKISVEIYDSTFNNLADYEKYIALNNPPVVGLYCNLMTKFNILKMIQICKKYGSIIILGGPEPPYYAEEYLKRGADVVVIGEGELTLEELIPFYLNKSEKSLNEIDGIAFFDTNRKLVKTKPRTQIENLSDLPWPDRDSINLDEYLQTWKQFHGASSTSIITARGCPYTCTWCSHSVFGESHRRRTVEDVANEIAWIQKKYIPDQLWYADDVLTINKNWFLNFAAELKKREIKIPFECISRADRLSEDVIDALSEMGCTRLWIGAESGSQKILDSMQRKTNTADVQRKTKLLQEKGIQVGMFIMLGYEGEKISDLKETVYHLKKSNPDIFLTTVSYPIKGTKYYNEVEHKVVSNFDWDFMNDRDYIVQGRYSKKFYNHVTKWMVNDVLLSQLIHKKSFDIYKMFKLFIHSLLGRIGMFLTKNEKEQIPSGRGWSAKERAEHAW